RAAGAAADVVSTAMASARVLDLVNIKAPFGKSISRRRSRNQVEAPVHRCCQPADSLNKQCLLINSLPDDDGENRKLRRFALNALKVALASGSGANFIHHFRYR